MYNIGVIVVSHYSGFYTHFDNIRYNIFTNEDIPCIFAYNGDLPGEPKLHETVYRDRGMNPSMYNKFIQTYTDTPALADADFIVRVNSSTFLSPKPLIKLISKLPVNGCYAGSSLPHGSSIVASGMCIIFSRDVMKMLCDRGSVLGNINDDLVIGKFMKENNIDHISTDVADQVRLEQGFNYIVASGKVPESCDPIYSKVMGQAITRIKNVDRSLDAQIWDILYRKYIYETKD
jgi:hypothetical protein